MSQMYGNTFRITKFILKKEKFGRYYVGYYFYGMATLVLKPTRLSPKVLEKIKEDVKDGVFPNDNKAINEILKKYYGIVSEFEIVRKKKNNHK